jgi:Asp-tRNA(Asn)/Glu-tRNA(Gln) amidotransferase A subunit family amidase
MPFGIQLCGRRGQDREILKIAQALEQELQQIEPLQRPVPDLQALTRAA